MPELFLIDTLNLLLTNFGLLDFFILITGFRAPVGVPM